MNSNAKKRKMIAWLVPLLVVAAVLVYVFSFVDDWSRDLSVNFAETSPTAKREFMQPVRMELAPDDVLAVIKEFVDSKSNWAIQDPSDNSDVRLALTRTTGLMRYVDDISVEIIIVDGSTVVNLQSQSRVGKGDLGQNPRNIIELNRWLVEQGGTLVTENPE